MTDIERKGEYMFKDAKVGDKVWDLRYGWGTVEEVVNDHQPILVAFSRDSVWFTKEGKISPDDECLQTLFWDEVKIVPPPRPKRKVKKVMEGWVNLYQMDHRPQPFTYTIYPTKEQADAVADHANRAGEAHFIHHEYEVVE